MITPFNRINLQKSPECWGKLSLKKQAGIREQEAFQMFFNHLALVALGRYDIDNVPDTCDINVIKQSLILGQCAFVKSEGKILSIMGYPGSDPSLYGYMKHGCAFGYDGTDFPLDLYIPGMPDYVPQGDGYEACLVYENFNGCPFFNVIFELANECADTWLKMGVARRNAAVPFVTAGDETSVSSIRQSLDQLYANQDAVVLNFGFSMAKGNIFPIQDAMKGISAFEEHLHYLLNFFYTLCGIPSNPVERKKERVNSSEIESSGLISAFSIDSTMEALEYYFGEVNRVFGTKMKPVRKVDQYADMEGLGAETGSGNVRDA